MTVFFFPILAGSNQEAKDGITVCRNTDVFQRAGQRGVEAEKKIMDSMQHRLTESRSITGAPRPPNPLPE